MTVLGLDHVNIRTADVPATVAFFRDILGLRAEPAPGAASIETGSWVYDPAGRPIVHIGGVAARYPSDADRPFTAAEGGGALHHVALGCDDFAGTRDRIAAAGLAFSVNDVPSFSLRQLFVAEPNGVLLELNFRDG